MNCDGSCAKCQAAKAAEEHAPPPSEKALDLADDRFRRAAAEARARQRLRQQPRLERRPPPLNRGRR